MDRKGTLAENDCMRGDSMLAKASLADGSDVDMCSPHSDNSLQKMVCLGVRSGWPGADPYFIRQSQRSLMRSPMRTTRKRSFLCLPS